MPPFAPPPDDAPSTVREGGSVHVEVRAPYASAPSTSDLLERAAALGPARLTWESIVLPADPILDEKRTPHVAERRARLTRLVKGALGACVAVCVLALGVTALSGGSSTPDAAAGSSAAAKTIPSKSIVPVETLSIARHGKAAPPSMIVAQARPAPFVAAPVRGKRR